MICEYDEYGPIPETKSLVDTFVTIDLHSKSRIIENKKRTIFVENNIDEVGFDVVLKKCKEFGEKCQINESVVLILLEKCNWDMNRLEELWAQSAPTMLANIGLSMSNRNKDPGLRQAANDGTCSICYEDYPKEELYSLPCGHAFCKGCWVSYIETKVGEGIHRIECQQEKCKCILPVTCIKDFCAKGVYENLLKFITDTQQSISNELKICPNPRCSKPLNVIGVGPRYCDIMKCTHCRTEFCIKCFAKSHAPATCAQIELWGNVTNEDIIERRLLGDKRKLCPRCNFIIEKNEGCNHMTCLKCRHEFCWVCLGDWAVHNRDFYHCNANTPAAQRYLEKPDDINPSFLEKYNDIYIRSNASANEFEQKGASIEELIRNRIAKESGIEHEYIQHTVQDVIDQIIWALRNCQWAAVVLFFDRYNQLKQNRVDYNNQPTSNLKYTKRYCLVQNAMNELLSVIKECQKIVSNAQSSTIPNLRIKDISRLKLRLKLAREVLLKQCDPLYKINNPN